MPGDDPILFTTERLRARELGTDDEAVLQRVFREAGDYFLSITGRPEPDPDAARRELASSASTPGRAVALLSLLEGDAPVGAVGWWQGNPEPDIALVGMLVLVPAERGRGLAREALDGLAAHLATAGVRRLRTGVAAGDRRLHALLASLGFLPLDRRTHISLDRGRIMIALFERGSEAGGEAAGTS